MRFRCTIAIPPLMIAALSCSSSLEPRSNVTILITNASCAPGPCATMEILAFPTNQPAVSTVLWSLDLGTMTGPQLCVTIPTSSTATVNDGGEITKYLWTTAIPTTLGAEPPTANPFDFSPSTSEFVPATAVGWSITLPGGTQAVPGPSCTP